MDTNLTTVNFKELASYRVLMLLMSGKARTQIEACEAEGISPDTFLKHMRTVPELRDIFDEYKLKLHTGIAVQVENFANAEQVFVADLIVALTDPLRMLQDRVMAHNKLTSIMAPILNVTKTAGEENTSKNDALALLEAAKGLTGARLLPAVSKVTVEFTQSEIVEEGELVSPDYDPTDSGAH